MIDTQPMRRAVHGGVRTCVARREIAERAVARAVADAIRERPNCVLGLPTGNTPVGTYREFAKICREEELDLSRVSTFNLDEYLGLRAGHPASFRSAMDALLFDHVAFDRARTLFPDVDVRLERAGESAARYERAIRDAGGIDLLLLGVGRNGHIAFNEPGSPKESRTRVVELHEDTRSDAARTFGGLERVPTHAITMGVATLCDARRIAVLAFGAAKATVVRRMLLDPVGEAMPATFLRGHPGLEVWLDEESAAELGGA